MKISTLRILGIAASLVLISGCKKKADTNATLDQAVKAMEEPAPAAVQPAAPAAAPATPQASAAQTVPQQMNQAVTSYKSGNYVDAVTRLQWLRARKGNTPEQVLALQQATAAVMGEIYAQAAKGDARAKQAVKEYERLQNSQ